MGFGDVVVPPPPPNTFCDECAAELAQLYPTTDVGSAVSAYCEHNKVGGLFIADQRLWEIERPIERDKFHEELIARGLTRPPLN